MDQQPTQPRGDVPRRHGGDTGPGAPAIYEALQLARAGLDPAADRTRAELLVRAHTEVLELVAAAAPLEASLGLLVRRVDELVPGTSSVILLLDEDRRIEPVPGSDLPPAFLAAIAGRVLVGDEACTQQRRELAAAHGLHGCISTPLCDAGRRMVATLALFARAPGAAEAWGEALVATAAHVAEVAIQAHASRAALAASEARSRAAEAELRTLSARLLATQDEERRRVARELHDSTGQNLATLAINLSLLEGHVARPAEHLRREALGLVDTVARELRTMAYVLHPPLLEELGLAAALAELIAGFTRRSGTPVAFTAALDVGRLRPAAELALFRVAQEGLANVHRHARGARASVELRQDGDTLILAIRDDGQPLPDGERPVGVGVLAMRERVREIGGTLTVSHALSGTTVIARVPLAEVTS